MRSVERIAASPAEGRASTVRSTLGSTILSWHAAAGHHLAPDGAGQGRIGVAEAGRDQVLDRLQGIDLGLDRAVGPPAVRE